MILRTYHLHSETLVVIQFNANQKRDTGMCLLKYAYHTATVDDSILGTDSSGKDDHKSLIVGTTLLCADTEANKKID